MITIGKLNISDNQLNGGYLVSENLFSSNSDSDSHESSIDNSDIDGDNDGNENVTKRSIKSVKRSYDVAGVIQQNENLPESSSSSSSSSSESSTNSDPINNSDNEIPDPDQIDEVLSQSTNSMHNESNTSSGSDDEAATDTDDTGTVADRRPKSKRFHKIFVVNKMNSSSSSETDTQSSDANDLDDSSDNDTDTEQQNPSGIILNYMKIINDEKPLTSDDHILNDLDNNSNSTTTTTTTDEENNQDYDCEDPNRNQNSADDCNNGIILCSIKTLSDDGDSIIRQKSMDNDVIPNKNTIEESTVSSNNETINLHVEPTQNFTNTEKLIEHKPIDFDQENIGNLDEETVTLCENQIINDQSDTEISINLTDDPELTPNLEDNSKTVIDDNLTTTITIVNLDQIDLTNVLDNHTGKPLLYDTNSSNLSDLNSSYCNEENNKAKVQETSSTNDHNNDVTNDVITPQSASLHQTSPTTTDNESVAIEHHIANDEQCNDQQNINESQHLLQVFTPEKITHTAMVTTNTVTSTNIQQETTESSIQVTDHHQQYHELIPPTTLLLLQSSLNNDHTNVKNCLPTLFVNNSQTTTTKNNSGVGNINYVNQQNLPDLTLRSVENEQSNCTGESNFLCDNNYVNHNTKYTSLVMITQPEQEMPTAMTSEISRSPITPLARSNVNVIATDTTHIVTDDNPIIVQHTNLQQSSASGLPIDNTLTGYFTRSLEEHPSPSITSSSSSSSSAPSRLPRRQIKITTHNNNSNSEKLDQFSDISDVNYKSDQFISNSDNVKSLNFSDNSSEDNVVQSSNSLVNKNFHKKNRNNDDVTVITGGDTLSAVICLEDGLADDDSWVEEISQNSSDDNNNDDDDDDDDDFTTTTPSDTDVDSSEEILLCSPIDREEELRGYNRMAIDFTLHTIVEESCEDSEIENSPNGRNIDKIRNRMSASELEKYFFYGLADGKPSSINSNSNSSNNNNNNNNNNSSDNRDDSISETSSLCSEALDSLGGIGGIISAEDGDGNTSIPSNDEDEYANQLLDVNNIENDDLASSRLEKYFLTGFMGFTASSTSDNPNQQQNRQIRNQHQHHHHHYVHQYHNDSDGSGGSVGSDSEGHPSPGQRRKRLVRARGTPRSHNSSLDNLLATSRDDLNNNETSFTLIDSHDTDKLSSGTSSDTTDTYDDTTLIDNNNNTSDGGGTLKRTKKHNKKRIDFDKSFESVIAAVTNESASEDDDKEMNATAINLNEVSPTDNNNTNDNNSSADTKTSQSTATITNLIQSKKQHSRDSGFIGSNDDLLKNDDRTKSPELKIELEEIEEDVLSESVKDSIDVIPNTGNLSPISTVTKTSVSTTIAPTQKLPSTSLTRKDSFNNWSSDEETNLMMSKVRQFFKTLIAASANAENLQSKPTTPTISQSNTPKSGTTPIPRPRQNHLINNYNLNKVKPPQLVYFENELTRLMKTVPGINDEQVREIVEYLSSEDTWSDSYDSSDYTSSDLEGAAAAAAIINHQNYSSSVRKSELQEQISASCQQIIQNFDINNTYNTNNNNNSSSAVTPTVTTTTTTTVAAAAVGDEEGDRGDGGLFDENQIGLNRETALVYQKLINSFSKLTTPFNQEQLTTTTMSPADVSSTGTTSAANKSPPIFAKVMSHIGTRLVALMHEVSSGGDSSHASSTSPKRHHRKLQPKISATTTEDDDDDDDDNDEGDDDEIGHCSTTVSGMEQNKNLVYLNLPRSKSHDLLLSGSNNRQFQQQQSGMISDTNTEEKEASDYERFSWRGSFESALLANGDSRTKLTMLDRDNSTSASALAAKRRSAGDLLFNQKSLSREQLDRVKSCGSIGGGVSGITSSNSGSDIGHPVEMDSSKVWISKHKSGKRYINRPDKSYKSDDTSDDSDNNVGGGSVVNILDDDQQFSSTRSTLPRSLQNTLTSSTNSLPRLSTSATNLQSTSTTNVMQKSQSVYHFLPNSVKSARYRAPGFNNTNNNNNNNSGNNSGNRSSSMPSKKAISSPGLSLYAKRDTRRRAAQSYYNEESNICEIGNSPLIGNRNGGSSGTNSPIQQQTSNDHPRPSQSDEDIDRLVALHQNRSSLSSLGVRSDSMASVYSGAGDGRYGTVAVKGQVEFGMQYNYKQGALEIHVVKCKELAAVDTKRNRSDPYVKLYLLPDKSKGGKRKTKVKKHTLNPVFDETLKFYMSLSSLESRTLWLTVWHSDMFGRNDFLGEVTISLQGKVFDNPQPQWYLLQERSEPFDDITTYKGDIIVGLKFIPPDGNTSSPHSSNYSSSGSSFRKFGSMKSSMSSRGAGHTGNISSMSSTKGALHVLVKEAKNLTPLKANGFCDAFCKSYLLPDKNRSSKQKTPVVKRTCNPTWNYTFIYDDVSLNDLTERALELTIWDHDRLASNEFLGGVRFSVGTGKHYGKTVDWMDATGKELSLWQNMLNRPNFWVEGCLSLRSSLDGNRNNS